MSFIWEKKEELWFCIYFMPKSCKVFGWFRLFWNNKNYFPRIFDKLKVNFFRSDFLLYFFSLYNYYHFFCFFIYKENLFLIVFYLLLWWKIRRIKVRKSFNSFINWIVVFLVIKRHWFCLYLMRGVNLYLFFVDIFVTIENLISEIYKKPKKRNFEGILIKIYFLVFVFFRKTYF